MTRVISYTRFSSRKQAKGLSYVRQIEAAREWCRENGHTLDESDQFNDLGVSAFSGANAATGALAELQKMLSEGKIERGTVLVVEALDRITRQTLTRAITLLMNLANSGLTIVTLSDKRVWNEQTMNDLGSFMMSVVTLYRGHQESEYKSMRLRKTFKKHRETGSQRAFGAAPGWLTREDKTKPWVVDPEKAAVIHRVFELAAAGFGSKSIAKRANDEGWPVPTRLNITGGRWHAQMPGIILRNRAVLGEHQHRIHTHEAHAQHWRGLPVGEPIKDYYPRIVSDELWIAARAAVATRQVERRRDTHYYNIFSGLMYCGHCGAPIHRKHEKKGYSRAQLYCSDKTAGKSKCKTMSARVADPTILKAIYEYAYTHIGGDDAAKRSAEIASLKLQIKEKQEECARIADAVARTGGRVQAFIEKSIALTEEAENLKESLTELEFNNSSSGDVFDESFVEGALKYLYEPGDEETEKRALLHLQMTRLVETIWLFAYDCAFIKFKNEPAPLCTPLPAKRLPSRANPAAKHHKPPVEKPEPEKPIFSATLSGASVLQLPEPRKTVTLSKRQRDYLLALDDDDEESDGVEF